MCEQLSSYLTHPVYPRDWVAIFILSQNFTTEINNTTRELAKLSKTLVVDSGLSSKEGYLFHTSLLWLILSIRCSGCNICKRKKNGELTYVIIFCLAKLYINILLHTLTGFLVTLSNMSVLQAAAVSLTMATRETFWCLILKRLVVDLQVVTTL